MQLSLTIWLVIACLAPATIYAQVPFLGKCPEIKGVDPFDVEAYMGIWYEYSRYPFIFEVGKKCNYAEYAVKDNSTISVVNSAIGILTNNPSNVTGIGKLLAPGELAVSFSEHKNPTRANYIVLSTDYDSYAVVYSCTDIATIANIKTVWILTRSRNPSQESIDAAKKVLKDNGISQAFLIKTMQDGCPAIEGGDNESSTTVFPSTVEQA